MAMNWILVVYILGALIMISSYYQIFALVKKKKLLQFYSNPDIVFNKCSYNINRFAFCHNNLVNSYSEVAGIHPVLSSAIVWAFEICSICKFLYCWNECEFDVEFCGILSGEFWFHTDLDFSFSVVFINYSLKFFHSIFFFFFADRKAEYDPSILFSGSCLGPCAILKGYKA